MIMKFTVGFGRTSNTAPVRFLLTLILLALAACAPAEEAALVLSSPTPTITVEALVKIEPPAVAEAEPQPTATPPNTSTPRPSATPTATLLPDPTETPLPTETATATPEPVQEAVRVDSAENNLTVTPLEATQIATGTPMPTTEPDRQPNPVASSLDQMIERIIIDAEAQSSVTRDVIQVSSIEEVTWPSGAIGCPQPGYAYTQALVDGFLITLDAAGKQMPYHTAGTKHFVYCTQKQLDKEKPPSSGGAADS